jgi:hypothetical protein
VTLLAAAMAALAAAVANIAAVVVAAALTVSIPAFNLQVMMTASLTTWPLCTSVVLKKREKVRSPDIQIGSSLKNIAVLLANCVDTSS